MIAYSSVTGDEYSGALPTLDKGAEDGPRRNQDAPIIAGPLGGGGIGPEETLVPIDIRNALRADGKTGVGTPGTGIGEAGDPAFAVTETSQAVAYALRKDPGGTGQGHNTNYVHEAASVRRLTPTECERLQGFPDGWTDLGGTPDSRRYAALGDAVTVPVAEWIGRRIRAAA